jgi:hypothetical protein
VIALRHGGIVALFTTPIVAPIFTPFQAWWHFSPEGLHTPEVAVGFSIVLELELELVLGLWRPMRFPGPHQTDLFRCCFQDRGRCRIALDRCQSLPWVEWREVKDGLGRFSPGKGRWDAARFHPEPRHRLEAYATLLSGVSSDISKCFLTVVLRAHRHHARV